MKRLLLLLLVAVSAFSVSAQKDYRGNDRNERYHYKHKGDKRHDLRNNKHNRAEFKKQVMAINHRFDERARAIQKNPFMGRNQKAKKMRELEMHRRMALNECRDRFNVKQRDYANGRRYGRR